MSPLEIHHGDGSVEVLDDETRLNLAQWGRLIGLNYNTIYAAASRGKARMVKGEPPFTGRTAPVQISVECFPKLILGCQRAQTRADGHRHHPWADGVKTNAKKFEVTPITRRDRTGRKRLVWRRGEGQSR